MIVKFRSCHICNQLSFPGHFKKKKKKLYLYIGTQLESEVVTYPSDPPMARLLLNTPTSRWRCKSLPSKKKTGCDVGVVWIVGFFPCCLDCWFFELNEVSLFFFSGWWACFFCWFFQVGLFEAHHPHQQNKISRIPSQRFSWCLFSFSRESETLKQMGIQLRVQTEVAAALVFLSKKNQVWNKPGDVPVFWRP